MSEAKEKYKILVISILLADACLLTYYFHAVLDIGTIFTHYFYIPIILAALWWRRKGLVVAIFLALLILFSHIFVREEVVTANDYFRVLMFIVIAFVVVTLSERIAKAQKKSDHLKAILSAIRNVNQLIVREKDRDRLIQRTCDYLIETRGYYSAWIALVDESHRFLTAAEAGLGESFSQIVEMMKHGEFTRCGQNALKQSGIMIVKDVAADCADCPLVSTYSGRAGLAVRLEYCDMIYGILSVSIPAEMAADDDEQSLFNEVAGDIALALRNIELEEARKRAEKALRELNEELEERVKKRTAELTKANEELKQEITERKRTEEKLRLFSQAADSSPDGVAMGNFEGRITYVNGAFVRMFGYSKEELIGKEIASIYSKDQIPKLEEALKATMEGGWTGELVGKRKNGELFPMAISSTVVMDEEGSVIAHMASHRDITERKRTEEAVRKSEARLNKAQRLAQIGSWELDLITNTLYWSDEVYRIFDLEPQQFSATYEAFLDNVHRDDREFVNNAYTESVKSKTPYDIVHRLLLKDGTIKFVNEHCETFYDDAGKAVRSIGTIHDITERKRAEEEVKEAYRLREHFLKETSHRIITPVAIIGGNTDLLLDRGNLDDAQKEKIRIIRERNEEVHKLVRDALAGKYLEEEGEEEKEKEGGEG